MNKAKSTPPAAAAPDPVIEAADDDMDGGFTIGEGGQKMRIILDGRGVFKAHVPAGKSLPARGSSMDEASARALTTTPADRSITIPGGQAGAGAGAQGGDQGAGGQAAGGFKVGG